MIEAAMKLLYVRDPETGEFKPLIAIKGDQGIQGVGRNAWIRFSAHADGTDYTSTWTDGQFYIGFASSITEPIDKSDYVWVNLLQVASVFVTSETGQSDRLAISQKTFTESLETVADNHDAHSEEIASIESDITTLTNRISAEETTRAKDITTLTNRISTEETTRSNAIAALQSDVKALNSSALDQSAKFTQLVQRVVRLEDSVF